MVRGFSQVDVFTSELGLGNTLAVIHDAEGMTQAEMLRFRAGRI
jgi:predicted PhzF superfamily epimerase YddE/YHI9